MSITEPLKTLQLSPREIEVLKWTACGKTSGEIARLLSITEDTVNAHVKGACAKLNAANKTHATAIAIAHGVMRLGPLPDLVIPLPTLLGLSMDCHEPPPVSGTVSRTSERAAPKKESRER